MQKKRKSLIVSALAVFALGSILAGCGGKDSNEPSPSPSNTAPVSSEEGNTEEENNENAVWEFGSEPFEFSAYAHYGWLDFPLEMEDVPFWKYLKENKQLNVKSIQAQGNHSQLMATMMTSDDSLPELIYTDRYHPDVDRLYEAGKLVAFDDYLDKYPNLKKWVDSQNLDLLRSPDGKIYKFPNWYATRPTGNAGYVVNKTIYKELGEPKLETLDDFYDYLVAVKNKYGADVVPFEPDRAVDAQGLGVLYTAFGDNLMYKSLSSDVLGVWKDNQLQSLFDAPEFREAQKFIAKLYREKLVSQDMFTQDRGAVLEKLMNNRAAIYAGSGPTTYASQAHNELIKTDPDSGYFMINPIHKAGVDQSKVHPGGYDTLGWNVSVITVAAKDPEKIFAFLDYCTSPEGMAIQFFGEPGADKNWTGLDENGNILITDRFNPSEVAEIQAKNDPVMIAGNTDYIDPAKIAIEKQLPEKDQNWVAYYQNEITWPSANDITAFVNYTNPEPDSELGDARAQITDLFLQVYADTATAKSDEEVDKLLDKAQKDAEKLGYSKLLEWRTEKILQNKKTLGQE